MLKAEQETHILFNRADADDGYFIVDTTIKQHFETLVDRVGGRDKFIQIQETKDASGVPIAWMCRIPIGMYSQATLGIKSSDVIAAGKARMASLDPSAKAALFKKKAAFKTEV